MRRSLPPPHLPKRIEAKSFWCARDGAGDSPLRASTRCGAADDAASLALAARLQAEEDAAALKRHRAATLPAHAAAWRYPLNDGSLYDGIGFHLSRIVGTWDAPPPARSNDGAVCFEDLVRPDATTGAVRCALLAGCGIELNWLIGTCPMLLALPKVFIICQPGGLQGALPHNFEAFSPAISSPFEKQHSKFIIVEYERKVRVSVTTANFNDGEWEGNITNAVWLQNFPRKAAAAEASEFERELLGLLGALGWPGRPCTCMSLDTLRRYDYSDARVKLVASVKGKHRGEDVVKYGHRRLRALLGEQRFDAKFGAGGSRLVAQVSSIPTLKQTYCTQLFDTSMGAGLDTARKPLGPAADAALVWPTVTEINSSLNGSGVGGTYCGSKEKLAQPVVQRMLHRWGVADGARDTPEGRSRALAHMKCFGRYHAPSGEVAWFLLGSHNLSQGAWGQELHTKVATVKFTMFEMSVLLLPSLVPNCMRMVTTAARGGTRAGLSGGTLALPLPFGLPPARYAAGDEPWHDKDAAYAAKK